MSRDRKLLCFVIGVSLLLEAMLILQAYEISLLPSPDAALAKAISCQTELGRIYKAASSRRGGKEI